MQHPHKNYATLVPIQIRVYDDRIMVVILFGWDFIEAWGRGIQKIKDSCIWAGNGIPEYKAKREDITVTLIVFYLFPKAVHILKLIYKEICLFYIDFWILRFRVCHSLNIKYDYLMMKIFIFLQFPQCLL